MNKFFKYFVLCSAAFAVTSCADEIDTLYYANMVEAPEGLANNEYLNQYKTLKNYVDRNQYPNLSIAACLEGSDFVDGGVPYLLAKTNFDQAVVASSFTTGSVVTPMGDYDWTVARRIAEKAKNGNLPLYLPGVVSHENQSVEYLNSNVRGAAVPEKTVDELVVDCDEQIVKISNANSKDTYVKNVDDGVEISVCREDPWYGFQFFLLSKGFQISPDYSYTATIIIESEDYEGSMNTRFGGWANIGTDQSISIKPGHNELELKFKPNEAASATFFMQAPGNIDKLCEVGETAGKFTVKSIKVTHIEQKIVGGMKEVNTHFVESDVRCLKVDSKQNANNYGTQVWMGDPAVTFKDGDAWSFSCRIRADKSVNIGSGIHGKPDGDYWIAGFDVKITATPEWQEYKLDGTFDASKLNNLVKAEKDNAPAYTIALDCALADADNVIYIDDISFKLNGNEVIKNGSFDSDDLSSFVVKVNKDFDQAFIAEGIEYDVKKMVKEYEEIPADVQVANLDNVLKKWFGGIFNITKGSVKDFEILSNFLAPELGKTNLTVQSDLLPLQCTDNSDAADVTKCFFWNEYYGKDYARVMVKAIREQAAQNEAGDIRLFATDDITDELRFKSFMAWISYWESDGSTKIDGIGANININYSEDESTQKANEEAVVNLLNSLKSTGKLVRINLNLGYEKADGSVVRTGSMTPARNEKMSAFYTFIIKKYLEIIPTDKQSAICMVSTTDSAKRPSGLWDTDNVRKVQYEGFIKGLGAEL